MQEEENIGGYFQRVEEVVNTMRGLEETMDETFVQKILRSLTVIFNLKVSAIEEREALDDLKLSQLRVDSIAYEIRIVDPTPKETAFKVTKGKH